MMDLPCYSTCDCALHPADPHENPFHMSPFELFAHESSVTLKLRPDSHKGEAHVVHYRTSAAWDSAHFEPGTPELLSLVDRLLFNQRVPPAFPISWGCCPDVPGESHSALMLENSDLMPRLTDMLSPKGHRGETPSNTVSLPATWAALSEKTVRHATTQARGCSDESLNPAENQTVTLGLTDKSNLPRAVKARTRR